MILTKELRYKSIIFDFDGTLIDSAPSILHCLELAFHKTGIPIVGTFNRSIIGPPLLITLEKLSGETDIKILNNLANSFKFYYDNTGYMKTTIYNGVPKLLSELNEKGCLLYLATNKRSVVTNKILNYLGWQHYFIETYSLDSFNPPLVCKKDLLNRVILEQRLNLYETIYVGDRLEDQEAALENKIDFKLANWGYLETHSK